MPVNWFLPVAGLVLTLATSIAKPDTPVRYKLSFPNAVHHEATITVSLDDVDMAPVELTMSRSSPGSYAVHEFAKNVYDVVAVDGEGNALKVSRDNPYSWKIEKHNGNVRLTYKLFADRADGTYSQIDSSHARLNAPSTFMWIYGFEYRPVEVKFDSFPASWKIATQLFPTDDPVVFTAPDVQYLLDSPIELSDFDMREWRIGDGDSAQIIRLVIHHVGSQEDVDTFAAKTKRVVEEQISLFGEAPSFDGGVYTFIADYLPYANADGMEHRNSTFVSNERSLHDADFAQLGLISHEFIHAWHAERLRPVGIEPFDFTRANSTPSLWFVEGFTSYYGPLTLLRAGERSVEHFVGRLAGGLSYVVNAPGRLHDSPQGMSLRAPFVDGAVSVDTMNKNTFLSYYAYGAIIALAMDLSIRQQFPDLSLDDYMRHMWQRYGRAETPYGPDDLVQGLAEVTGNRKFAREFFARYIDNSDLPDFAPLLAQAGLKLAEANADAPFAGIASFGSDNSMPVVSSPVSEGSPLYAVGIDQGDRILRVGETDVRAFESWSNVLARFSPGDTVSVEFENRSGLQYGQLTFVEDPELAITTYEHVGLTVSDAQLEFRESWLGRIASKALTEKKTLSDDR